MNADTIKKKPNLAPRPKTARPPFRQASPGYAMPRPTYAERPMTQAHEFRPLKTSAMYSLREKYLMQKYGSYAADKA